MNYESMANLLDFLSKRSLSYLLYYLTDETLDKKKRESEEAAEAEWRLLREVVHGIQAAEEVNTIMADKLQKTVKCEAEKGKVTLVLSGRSTIRRSMPPKEARLLAMALLQAATRVA